MEGDVDGSICSIIGERLGLGSVYLRDWLEHDEDSITIWHTGAVPFQFTEPVGTEKGPHPTGQFNNKRPTIFGATIRQYLRLTYHTTALEGISREPKHHLLATKGRAEVDGLNVREWFDVMIHQGTPHNLCVVHGHHADTFRRVPRAFGVRWHTA